MIAFLGGSGLYDLPGLTDVKRRALTTAFGDPSDEFVTGTLQGQPVCFLPRHGRGHRIMPSEINHRANIMGLKMLGAQRVISISAVGSLREALRPRDICLPDQYFDRTHGGRGHTFFGDGIVAHVSMADPSCGSLRGVLAGVLAREAAARGLDVRIRAGGTYVNMEGPAFSTRAESNAYRSLAFDVIGMTSLPEAKLCREAGLCYQAIAMVTDYDCWHATEAAVTVETIIGHLLANTGFAKDILGAILAALPTAPACGCAQALDSAIITDPAFIPEERRRALAPILGSRVAG